MSLTRDLDDNLINLEDSIGDATQFAPNQARATNTDTSGIFSPIKGIQTLPQSMPGNVLTTKKDQELASEMWLKASLDLAWENTEGGGYSDSSFDKPS